MVGIPKKLIPGYLLSFTQSALLSLRFAIPVQWGLPNRMTDKRTWKSEAFLIAVSAIGTLLICSGLVSTLGLPLLTSAGFLSWLVLLVLTLVASRFTVSITSTVGVSQSRKSVADAFVFLAIILYAVPPANTAGPATLLAAIVGLVSTYGLTSKKESFVTTAIAVISTFISAFCYGFLVPTFAHESFLSAGQTLPVNAILVPLCILAVLQYSLSTLATVYFPNVVDGKPLVLPSQESIVWSLTTQVAGAASAALFYSALTGGGLPFIFLGLLIIGLIHLLYRFNEKRLN